MTLEMACVGAKCNYRKLIKGLLPLSERGGVLTEVFYVFVTTNTNTPLINYSASSALEKT